MLIEKFVVPESELADVGLQAIEMNRLGRFVALTGKNGAGKTRILNKLNGLIPLRNQYLQNTASVDQQIDNYTNAIKSHPPEHPNQTQWKNELERCLSLRGKVFSSINTPLGVLRKLSM